MVFAGKANGSPATFLVNSGATQCFVDSAYAQAHGLVQSLAHSQVHLANDLTQTASMKTTVHLEIQGHKISITCYVLDMQEIEVVPGDNWLRQTAAVMDYGNVSRHSGEKRA